MRWYESAVDSILSYTEPRTLKIRWMPLGLMQTITFLLAGVYFTYELSHDRYLTLVPGDFLFAFDTLSDGWEERDLVYDDLFSGTRNKWYTHQYLQQEADNVLFVATNLDEKRQRWDGTDWHDVSERQFTITKDQLANITVQTIARMGCQADSKYGSTMFYGDTIHNYKMFSNYKKGDANLQSNYNWSIVAALSSAHVNGKHLDPCYNDTGIDCRDMDASVWKDTSIECCQYAGYLTTGIDLLIGFDWSCNLAQYDLENNPDDRYKCAQDIEHPQARIVSSSSTVYTTKIYKDAAPSMNGNEYRRVLEMHGIRMRFQGNGGCLYATPEMFLAIGAESLALMSGMAVLLLLVKQFFFWKMGLSEPIVTMSEGLAGLWYLQNGNNTICKIAEGKQMHGLRGCGAVPSHLPAAAQHAELEEFTLIPLKYQQQNNCHTSLVACCHKEASLSESTSNDKGNDDDDQLQGEVVVEVPLNRKAGDILLVWHELQGHAYEVVVPEGAVPGDRIAARHTSLNKAIEVVQPSFLSRREAIEGIDHILLSSTAVEMTAPVVDSALETVGDVNTTRPVVERRCC